MEIRILPSNIANMIAAGEVVQRPGSVVKELIENAVDAGATQVNVIVQDAGRTLIQVIDNGCGMSPDDAVICFERHATSKLRTSEDLMNILTFGFRGEALASIASVAQVKLKTRREEDEVGCEVIFADSRNESTEMVATPVGTNITVRDLFYNIPARRKHLKSDNIELKHIVSEITRIALVYPEKGFNLTHNGRDVLVLKPAMSLKYRIQALMGSNVVNDVVTLNVDTSVVKITGYIGKPAGAKKGLGNQFLFVNDRYFRSAYFNKAILKGYENLISESYTPSYVLYFEVDPHTIDVNVHPTKTEVKFENDSVIFQVLVAAVKEALGKNSFGASIDFDREGAPDIPIFGREFKEYQPQEPTISLDANYNPFEQDGLQSDSSSYLAADYSAPIPETFPSMPQAPLPSFQRTSFAVDKRDDYGKLFEDTSVPAAASLIVQKKYILVNVSSGVMMINIRRANERIFFDRFMDALSKRKVVTQNSLFPVQVEVGVENMLLFQEHSELLNSLGFDIVNFGHDTIVVNGVPEGYTTEPGKVHALVSDLIYALSDNAGFLPEQMRSNMAEKFARLGAIGVEPPKNQKEAQTLIDLLFSSQDSNFTSSGKKIVNILSLDDIDKRF